MAVTIDTIFAKQFSPRILMLSQQKDSRIASKVRIERVNSAEEAYFDTISAEDAPEESTTRHGDTPLGESTWGRRRVIPAKWHKGTLLDEYDKARMLGDPQGVVLQSYVASFARKRDALVRDAAFGEAYIGKTGATSVGLEDESIGINGTTGGIESTLGSLPVVSTPVTMELIKILRMTQIFNEADVDPDIPRYWAVSPKDIAAMLDIEEIGSADYNTVKALSQGKVDTYCGFNFFWTNNLTKDAATETANRTFAWAEDGLILAYIGEMNTRITERDDKQFSTQVYSKMDLGAVRMEGAKVHECLTVL